MIKKFWHVGMTVKSLDDSIVQYKKLGFEVVDKFEKPEPHAMAAILTHPNGSGIELWQWLDLDHPQVEFIKSHLAFISNDQDADVQKLVDEGWEIVIPKTTGVIVTYVFLRDPSGNYVEIADVKD
jgi:catechol 2,3-dioxygenase-like lactoylglutathione lyase family enzyme